MPTGQSEPEQLYYEEVTAIFMNGNTVHERTKLSKNGYVFQGKGVTASGNSVLIRIVHYWMIPLIIENDYRKVRFQRFVSLPGSKHTNLRMSDRRNIANIAPSSHI
jgi:hypothetical protein